ncbi:carboxypeptidase-like regulatory domain-containing protein [Mucilaginibacter ximonensis]|uniref:Carboxypeptidase-like regulatory domain-containing protein n=1 Tax=Mucilaginibacter ximonensis TaxID=538021 RepID=A0ABW5Y7E5_9SPHI
MKYFFSLILFCLLQLSAWAQMYDITGTVKNIKGEPIQAASVFIAGSEQAVATDAEGRFRFGNLTPGTYQLVVNMLGFEPEKRNVILTDKPEAIDVILNVKSVMLAEVNVGDKSQREKQVKTFIQYFMGESSNAKYCKILNPDLLEFSTAKGVLKATTSDFLIIENNALGYRIKYLLKTFSHEAARDITNYEGDYTFEQMKGTPEQQQKWEKKRQEAYEGSLMHYLRALYAGKSREEVFLVYKILSPVFPLVYESIPIVAEQIIKRPEKSLITFRYDKRFYIVYDKKAAARTDPKHANEVQLDNLDYYGSIFNTDARVDSRGAMTSYDKLLIQGFWGRKRVADQLPFEYVPPAVAAK